MKSSPPQRRYYLAGPNRHIAQAVKKMFAHEPLGNLLDVGAGDGWLTKQISHMGFAVSACDIDLTQFKPGHTPIKQANFNLALPYRHRTFRYILCSEVIEHIENPWVLIREIHRILKPQGKFVITLPNFSNLLSRLTFFARGNFRQFNDWTWKNWGHINPITYAELGRILADTGFRVEQITASEEITQPYAFVLKNIHSLVFALFGLSKKWLLDHDRRDKLTPLIDSRTLKLAENLVIKCRKKT